MERQKDGKMEKTHTEDMVQIPNICLISYRQRGEVRTANIFRYNVDFSKLMEDVTPQI